jgi:hypothetical protein
MNHLKKLSLSIQDNRFQPISRLIKFDPHTISIVNNATNKTSVKQNQQKTILFDKKLLKKPVINVALMLTNSENENEEDLTREYDVRILSCKSSPNLNHSHHHNQHQHHHHHHHHNNHHLRVNQFKQYRKVTLKNLLHKSPNAYLNKKESTGLLGSGAIATASSLLSGSSYVKSLVDEIVTTACVEACESVK